MNKTNIIYWILTGLFAFIMFGSAIPDVLMVEMAKQGFKEMQMPAYLLPFLGVAKITGAVVILISGYPRLKEWAYAGLMFDLLGATYAIAASGKTAENWTPMFLLIALGFGSYIYYHKRLKEEVLNQLNKKFPTNIKPEPLQKSWT